MQVNIVVGTMGEINQWPYGLVEIQPRSAEVTNKAFNLPCEINKNGQAKTPAPPPPQLANGGPLSSSPGPLFGLLTSSLGKSPLVSCVK